MGVFLLPDGAREEEEDLGVFLRAFSEGVRTPRKTPFKGYFWGCFYCPAGAPRSSVEGESFGPLGFRSEVSRSGPSVLGRR